MVKTVEELALDEACRELMREETLGLMRMTQGRPDAINRWLHRVTVALMLGEDLPEMRPVSWQTLDLRFALRVSVALARLLRDAGEWRLTEVVERATDVMFHELSDRPGALRCA